LRVIVADDHSLVRKAVCFLLESSRDFRNCVEAADGHEAVQRSLELNPRLVILDISMPLVDGFSAAKQIRDALPRVPILIYSADESPEAVEYSRAVGAQGFVNKSEIGEILLQAVDVLLAGGTFFPSSNQIDRGSRP
jgi:DNA-binding NarL/FixJ family response regulator